MTQTENKPTHRIGGRMKKVALVMSVLWLSLFLALICASAEKLNAFQGCPMRFAVIGDRTGSHQPGIYEQIVGEIEGMKPDFVLSVGDMIEGYTGDTMEIKRQRDEYKTILKPLTVPIYFAPGNHDITDSTYIELYKRQVGEPYYSFDIRGVHFIVLDNSCFDSVSAFPKEQLDWLISDLNKNKSAAYTIAFFHKPFWIETIANGKPDTLHALFVKYGVDAVFSGHYHTYFSGRFNDILYTGMGSSGGACYPGPTGLQYHFAWVTIDKDGIWIAPMKIGGVLGWDELTAAQFNLAEKIKSRAVKLDRVFFGTGMTLPETEISVEIENPSSDLELADTLSWKVPEGWNVAPISLALEIPPKGKFKTAFTVRSSGSIYPAPMMALKLPYAKDKKLKVEKSLGISRTAYAHKVTKPISIDGKLTDDAWKDPVNKLFSEDVLSKPTEPVDFYFAWDEQNLYLAARCTETRMDQIVASSTKQDGAVYAEDCVGYFIQPKTEDGPTYQIYFNPLGTPFDQKIEQKNGEGVSADRNWNGAYEIKTFKGKDYWSVEAKIPLSVLEAKIESGDTWAIGFRRKQKRLNAVLDWVIPTSYDSKDYGVLMMK